MSGRSKLMQFVNWRMSVTISDNRSLVGTFMAFDRHMNLVLADCEEYRTIKGKKGADDKTLKRSLGLVILRGQSVISITVTAPPLPKPRAPSVKAMGVARAAGRGMAPGPSAAMRGLAGPVAGVGGPGMSSMAPTNAPPGMGMPPPGMRMPPPSMGAPPPGMRPPM